jgi:hypothetical protein
MIAVGILLVALALSWFLLAGRGTGPLTPLERVYLVVSPLPVLLMFGIPLALELLRVSPDNARAWNGELDPVSIGLSTALILAGVALTWTRFARGGDRKSRLTAAIFLSGIPAFLTLLVGLFYGLRRVG